MDCGTFVGDWLPESCRLLHHQQCVDYFDYFFAELTIDRGQPFGGKHLS
jgi:hypothetical protein